MRFGNDFAVALTSSYNNDSSSVCPHAFDLGTGHTSTMEIVKKKKYFTLDRGAGKVQENGKLAEGVWTQACPNIGSMLCHLIMQ